MRAGRPKTRSYHLGKEMYEAFGPMTEAEMRRLYLSFNDIRIKIYLTNIYGFPGAKYAALMYDAWCTRTGREPLNVGRSKGKRVIQRGAKHVPPKAAVGDLVPAREPVHQAGGPDGNAGGEEAAQPDQRGVQAQGTSAPSDLPASGGGVPVGPPADNVRFCIDLDRPCPKPCQRCLRCICSYRANTLECQPCERVKNSERMRTRYRRAR